MHQRKRCTACFVTLAPFILPEVISRSRAAHPYLNIEVDEVDAEEAREAIRAGRAELSVGYDFAYGEGIKREVIATTPAHVLLPAGHPLAGRDRIFLRELGREKLILLDLPHSRDYFLQLLSSAGLEPEILHRSRNYETVRAMVAHGHGFSVLNQRPRHDLTYDGRQVAACRIADDVPALRVVIATLPGVRQTARAAALAEAIRGVFRDAASGGIAASGETAAAVGPGPADLRAAGRTIPANRALISASDIMMDI